jgi:hypothetical protein
MNPNVGYWLPRLRIVNAPEVRIDFSSLNLARVSEHRRISADGIVKSDFSFRFADGADGYLASDGEVTLTIRSEVQS